MWFAKSSFVAFTALQSTFVVKQANEPLHKSRNTRPATVPDTISRHVSPSTRTAWAQSISTKASSLQLGAGDINVFDLEDNPFIQQLESSLNSTQTASNDILVAKKLDYKIGDILKKQGITDQARLLGYQHWCAPYRHFHNIHYLNQMVEKILATPDLSESDKNNLVLLAFFHKVIHKPHEPANAEKSARFLAHAFTTESLLSSEQLLTLNQIILLHSGETIRDNLEVDNDLLNKFLNIKESVLLDASPDEQFEAEKRLLKECSLNQPIRAYKKARVSYLEHIATSLPEGRKKDNLLHLIHAVKVITPKIGLMVGSLNPTTIGHKDIVDQANKVFDCVVVGVGQNPNKTTTGDPNLVRDRLPYAVVSYSGSVEPLVKELLKSGEVSLIRGFGRPGDVEEEREARKPLEKMTYVPNAVVYFLTNLKDCSSSRVRALLTEGKVLEAESLMPPKFSALPEIPHQTDTSLN